MIVRVRYAPSPTGEPHVGNIRTALFNWLYARHMGGKFLLRIEDTDQARKVEGALDAIEGGLRWLGLDWDEGPDVGGPFGPYFQSERLSLYQPLADDMVRRGVAYRCWCSTARLDRLRDEQRRRKQPPGYDRHCREAFAADSLSGADRSERPVVRFKAPLDGATTVVEDVLHGSISFANDTLDDFVLLKSDGFPTYHFANVVDDHLMQITHVIRGDEWISSLPRHWLLYETLGYDKPQFVHLPVILGPDGAKLSKRHGATSILDYQRNGYLPEAMINFLALLGWSLDEKTELLSRDDLVKHFSLERLGKNPAVFNIEKLNWMNGVYVRQLSPAVLAEKLMPILQSELPPEAKPALTSDYLARIVPLVQDRLKLVAGGDASDSATNLTSFFFLPDLSYDAALLVPKGVDRAATLRMLEGAQRVLRILAQSEQVGMGKVWDEASLEGLLRPLAERLGVKTGQLFGILRVAVTGRTAAPPLFQTMAVLGRERCLARIAKALPLLEPKP